MLLARPLLPIPLLPSRSLLLDVLEDSCCRTGTGLLESELGTLPPLLPPLPADSVNPMRRGAVPEAEPVAEVRGPAAPLPAASGRTSPDGLPLPVRPAAGNPRPLLCEACCCACGGEGEPLLENNDSWRCGGVGPATANESSLPAATLMAAAAAPPLVDFPLVTLERWLTTLGAPRAPANELADASAARCSSRRCCVLGLLSLSARPRCP